VSLLGGGSTHQPGWLGTAASWLCGCVTCHHPSVSTVSAGEQWVMWFASLPSTARLLFSAQPVKRNSRSGYIRHFVPVDHIREPDSALTPVLQWCVSEFWWWWSWFTWLWREESQTQYLFMPSFTIYQILLCIMPGSFRYRTVPAIILEEEKKWWRSPSWTMIWCLVLPQPL